MKRFVTISSCIFLYIFCNLSQVNSQVLLKDNFIDIKVNSVSLEEILNDLHKKTGVLFLVDDRINTDIISVELEKQSLENVLQRLLKPYGKVIIYDKNGKIDKVEIFQKGTKPLQKNVKFEADPSGQITDSNDETNLISPSEFDTEMEVIESTDDGPVIDTSDFTKGSGMKLTKPVDGEMEIVLPKKEIEGM